jgi:hypothetical protein
MIYFLHGADTYKARKKLHELLSQAKTKRPEAELFKLTTENWNEGGLEELLVSRGLFEQKYTVVLDTLFEKKEIREYILGRLKDLSESDQIFLILEGKVDAAIVKKIEKVAKQVQEFKKQDLAGQGGEKKQTFNIFGVTDGLLHKDKKKLWISFIDAINRGVAVEEIHGIFFWQIKNMIIASSTKLSTSGLAPFSYNIALAASKLYSPGEMKKFSSNLLHMTHLVRRGKGDMEVMLERWILSLA